MLSVEIGKHTSIQLLRRWSQDWLSMTFVQHFMLFSDLGNARLNLFMTSIYVMIINKCAPNNEALIHWVEHCHCVLNQPAKSVDPRLKLMASTADPDTETDTNQPKPL